MKDKNTLVASKGTTFDEHKDQYYSLISEIKSLTAEKKYYDSLIDSNIIKRNLTFRDQINLYSILESLAQNNDDYNGIDLKELKTRLSCEFEDMSKYLCIKEGIEECAKGIDVILRGSINFRNFCNNEYFDTEGSEASLIEDRDGELICLNCGNSTEEYGLDAYEIEFLAKCAEKQGILIKKTDRKDTPTLAMSK